MSLRLTTASKTVELEELNAQLRLVKEGEQRQRGVVEATASKLPSTDAPVKSLILNVSDPFYASSSSVMDCDSTFQAQRLFLHQIC
jgi:hypothetical protein